MIKIFIADDHPILMYGLVGLIEDLNHTVVGTENNGQSALNFILKHEPDIAILDITMPLLTGIEVAQKCKSVKSPTKIIFLTLHKEIDFYLQAKKYNTFGYLLKDFAMDEIEECINSTINNIPYFSKKIKSHFEFVEGSKKALKELSFAEIRILKLMAELKTSKEIAEVLSLSPRTIHKHRSNIIEKLNLPAGNRTLNTWVEKNKSLFF
ncbi:MAG: response regulator transcription factor [Flavobacteriaceae bacterium]|nr:response regulator transcription factor [Flavobacteriaceae bacterium]